MITREAAQKLVERHINELEQQYLYWKSVQNALSLMLLRQAAYTIESILQKETLNAVERGVYETFLAEIAGPKDDKQHATTP